MDDGGTSSSDPVAFIDAGLSPRKPKIRWSLDGMCNEIFRGSQITYGCRNRGLVAKGVIFKNLRASGAPWTVPSPPGRGDRV